MALQRNIDAKGKRVRFIYGLVLVVAGMVSIWRWAWAARTVLGWTVSVAVVLAGAFAIFEARAGWCAARALGIKTRI